MIFVVGAEIIYINNPFSLARQKDSWMESQ